MLTGAVLLWGDFQDVTLYHWPRERPPIFGSHFAAFDGYFYLVISDAGYEFGKPQCAFSPLWPLLIRCCCLLLNGDPLVVGLVLANTLSVAAWTLLYAFVRRHLGARLASWSVVWLVTFPGSVFYQFLYSESIFLLILMALVWSIDCRRYGLGGLAAFSLALTRTVGVLTVVPLLWHVLSRAGRDRFGGVPARPGPAQEQRHIARDQPATLAAGNCPAAELASAAHRAPDNRPGLLLRCWVLLAPLCGFCCWLALMWICTGNPFEGFQAQRHWGVNSIGNLLNLPKFVLGFFDPTTLHEHRGSLLDRCSFLLLLYCLPTLRRLGAGLALWTCVLGILPAMIATFSSFTRYVSVSFPMFIALAVILDKPRRGRMRYLALVLFAALHIALAWRYVNFRWAG